MEEKDVVHSNWSTEGLPDWQYIAKFAWFSTVIGQFFQTLGITQSISQAVGDALIIAGGFLMLFLIFQFFVIDRNKIYTIPAEPEE